VALINSGNGISKPELLPNATTIAANNTVTLSGGSPLALSAASPVITFGSAIPMEP